MLARRIILAAAFAALTIATAARADGPNVAPRRVVVVHVNGTPDETIALEATMRELLSRLSLTMATGNAPASSVLETVTIDMTAVGAKVIVHSASGGVVLARTVRGESAAIQREQIAHAVRGAAEAELLVDADRVAGRAPPVEEPPPPPKVEPAPPPPPPKVDPPPPPIVVAAVPAAETPISPPPSNKESAALGLDLATFAGGGGFADRSPLVARVGGSVALASRRWLRPQIALAALYAFPFETGEETLVSRTKLFSLRVLPGLGLVREKWFGLDVAAGGGIDVLTVDPDSSTYANSAFRPSTTRVNGIFTGAVTARAEIAPDVSIILTAMLDIDPADRHYVLQERSRQTEIFSPWAFRPMLLAGLSFAALGGGR